MNKRHGQVDREVYDFSVFVVKERWTGDVGINFW